MRNERERLNGGDEIDLVELVRGGVAAKALGGNSRGTGDWNGIGLCNARISSVRGKALHSTSHSE